MEKFPKFIIEGDSLIIGKVLFHHELVTDKVKVKGGGAFRFDGTNTFILEGESHDFGKAKLEDIKKCVEEKKVFRDKPKYGRNLSEQGYKFAYNTGSEIINLSS